MTPAEINARIAEVCGWKFHKSYTDTIHGTQQTMENVWICEEQDDDFPATLYATKPPDYHGSLDSCALFEARLTDEQCSEYHRQLDLAHSQDAEERNGESEYPAQDFWFHATADQRCRAFLVVMGKEGK